LTHPHRWLLSVKLHGTVKTVPYKPAEGSRSSR